MKILMSDFDEVICINQVLQMFNEFKNTNYTYEDLGELYSPHMLLKTKEEMKEFWKYAIDKNFYNDATLMPDCYEVLKKLQDEYGYEIYILSKCTAMEGEELSGKIFCDKYNWILKNLPFIKPNNIIFTGSKQVIFGDIMIDDRLDNLNGKFKTKILFDSYHNKKYSEEELAQKNIIRLNNWKEIFKFLTNKEF